MNLKTTLLITALLSSIANTSTMTTIEKHKKRETIHGATYTTKEFILKATAEQPYEVQVSRIRNKLNHALSYVGTTFLDERYYNSTHHSANQESLKAEETWKSLRNIYESKKVRYS